MPPAASGRLRGSVRRIGRAQALADHAVQPLQRTRPGVLRLYLGAGGMCQTLAFTRIPSDPHDGINQRFGGIGHQQVFT